MSGAREHVEEAIAVCRDASDYFAANHTVYGEYPELARTAEAVVRNLEPLLGRLFLKTKSALISTYPCQQSARRIAGLLTELIEQGRPRPKVWSELGAELQTLERNSEIVKAAAASRDTIIT